MKIICIGRNYIEHANELNHTIPKQPVFFIKSKNALLENNAAFHLPPFSQEVHYEVEIVLKINNTGKNIMQHEAESYFNQMTVGIDLTARDLQRQCKEKGLPWEIAKSFDQAAPVGKWIEKKTLGDINQLPFKLLVNHKQVQIGNTEEMIFNFSQLIAYVSKFITLEKGDLFFTGTPQGVGPIQKNDLLQAYIKEQNLLTLNIQ